MEVYGCQLLYQFLIYGLATLITRCIRVCPLTSFVNCKLSIFFFPFFFFFNACFELFFVCVCVCVCFCHTVISGLPCCSAGR